MSKNNRISKYNMECKYDPKERYKLIDLCREVNDEFISVFAENTNNGFSDDTLLKHCQDQKKGTGVKDKLLKNLNINLYDSPEHPMNPKQLFEALKLVKVFLCIDKLGFIRGEKIDINGRTSYIDLLSKPKAEYVFPIDYYGSKTKTINTYLKKIKSEIELGIDNKKEKQDVIDNLNNVLNKHIHELLYFVFGNFALYNTKDTYNELNHVNMSLNKYVLDRLKNIDKHCMQTTDNAIETFYDYLLIFEKLCIDKTKIELNNELHITDAPSDDYIHEYKSFIMENPIDDDMKKKYIDDDMINGIKEYFKNKSHEQKYRKLCFILNYNKDIPEEDYSYYIKALDNLDNLKVLLSDNNELIRTTKRLYSKAVDDVIDIDGRDTLTMDQFIIFIQEIVSTLKNKDKVSDKHIGYKNSTTALKSSLFHPNSDNSIKVKLAWLVKIINRKATNIGACDLIKKMYDLENTLYNIKEYVFKYQDPSERELISHEILSSVFRYIIKTEEVDIFKKNVSRKFICYYNLKEIHIAKKYIKNLVIYNKNTHDKTPKFKKLIAKKLMPLQLPNIDMTFLKAKNIQSLWFDYLEDKNAFTDKFFNILYVFVFEHFGYDNTYREKLCIQKIEYDVQINFLPRFYSSTHLSKRIEANPTHYKYIDIPMRKFRIIFINCKRLIKMKTIKPDKGRHMNLKLYEGTTLYIVFHRTLNSNEIHVLQKCGIYDIILPYL